MRDSTKIYIDGEWVQPAGAETVEIINPATEEVVGKVSLASAQAVNLAVSAARKAFRTFAKSSRQERLDLLGNVLSVYEKRWQDLADALVEELGAPAKFAREMQVGVGYQHFQTGLEVLKTYAFGVGLMALSIAKGTGLGKVAAIDIDEAKLAKARNDFGADLAINSRSEGIAESLKGQTGGFIGIIDLVGSDKTISLGLSLLRNGGTYVGVGLFGGAVSAPLAVLNSRQISIKGSYVGTLQELRELVHHVQQGRIKQIPVSNEPISEINEGLKVLSAGKIDGRIVHLHAVPELAP